MSRCTPKNEEFMKHVQKCIMKEFGFGNTPFGELDNVQVYYDAGPCSKHDYVLRADIPYKSWNGSKTKEFKSFLSKIGAMYAEGKYYRRTYNYDLLEFAFDINEKKFKKQVDKLN